MYQADSHAAELLAEAAKRVPSERMQAFYARLAATAKAAQDD
jgi:hypothetical protein